MQHSMLEQIEAVLDARVRPQLLLHGGGIRSLSLEDGVYRFALIGPCANCPSAYLESRELVRAALLEAVPGLREAELVQEIGEELITQARAILSHSRRPDEDA